VTWRVPSLSLSGEHDDAVRLFVERARAVRFEFELVHDRQSTTPAIDRTARQISSNRGR
jgi:predicted ATPase